MRTFLRVSLLGNAFLDLACILLLLSHGRGNQPRDAAPSPKPAEVQAAVDNSNPLGVFAVEASFVPSELPDPFFPAFGGNTMLAGGTTDGFPVHPAYDRLLNWRSGKPGSALGGHSRPSP
jgi:hypothetical protein